MDVVRKTELLLNKRLEELMCLARVERSRSLDLDMLEASYLGEDGRSRRHGVVPADHVPRRERSGYGQS